MAYVITENHVVSQPIAVTSATQAADIPLGTVVRAKDATLGEGEFIYLLGVASTAVGSVVTYSLSTHQTALAPAGTNLPEAIAVAMSANVASQYGWYQISGLATASKIDAAAALASGAAVGVSTAGTLNATATGKEVQGALVATTSSASTLTVVVMLNRPHMQGRIT